MKKTESTQSRDSFLGTSAGSERSPGGQNVRALRPPPYGISVVDSKEFAGAAIVKPHRHSAASNPVHTAAKKGVSGTGGPLPHLDAIQKSFGKHDVSHIKVHTDGAAAAGARAMGAEAFATGNHVAFAGAPSLHTAAHEAAHVVQQRGGVQLKGGVGETGDRYEHHADQVADAVAQGRSAESLLDQYAGGSSRAATSATSSTAIQRKMGMEMEVGRRITSAEGDDLAGDTNLIDHPYFTVVSDKRKGYSNLEFVMKAFDQLAGSEEEALAALKLRMDAMKAFYDELYRNDDDRNLGDLPGVGTGEHDLYRPLPKDPDNPDGETWANAKVAPRKDGALPVGDRDANRGMLFCHFTVGYPIQQMHTVMTYLAGTDRTDDNQERARVYHARDRASEAVAVADAMAAADWAAGLSDGERDELKGSIALIYTQLAAFAIKMGGGPNRGELPGQIKNNTPILSRVPLHQIYQSLSAPVKAAMQGNQEAIVEAIADRLDKTADYGQVNYNDPDVRHVEGLAPVTLSAYAASGLSGAGAVSQQRVFGGMYERGLDVDHGHNLIPVELRSFRKPLMTFDEVRNAGVELVRQSRALLVPPAPPLAVAVAPVAAPAAPVAAPAAANRKRKESTVIPSQEASRARRESR